MLGCVLMFVCPAARLEWLEPSRLILFLYCPNSSSSTRPILADPPTRGDMCDDGFLQPNGQDPMDSDCFMAESERVLVVSLMNFKTRMRCVSV